jgi:hypothetical protein
MMRMRRDPIFHETPHQSPRDTQCSAGHPTIESLGEFSAELALIVSVVWNLGSLLHSCHKGTLRSIPLNYRRKLTNYYAFSGGKIS